MGGFPTPKKNCFRIFGGTCCHALEKENSHQVSDTFQMFLQKDKIQVLWVEGTKLLTEFELGLPVWVRFCLQGLLVRVDLQLLPPGDNPKLRQSNKRYSCIPSPGLCLKYVMIIHCH